MTAADTALGRGLSVVIPCYRSQDSLTPLVERLLPVLQALRPGAHEILLVVDGSPDNTWDIARTLAEQHPDTVRAVLLMRNYGQHNALLAGVQRACFDVTVTMDDDLQHLPEELQHLVAPLDDPSVDLVYGIADVEEHGVLRSLASRSVKRALGAAGVPSAGDVSALRAFRTSLRDAFAHVTDAYASIDVWLSWSTTSVVACQVRMERRTIGESGYSVGKLVRHAFNMITGFSEAPLRLVLYLGLLCGLLGAVLLGVVLFDFFTGRTTVAGFTTLAAVVSLFSSAQMLSIGVLGEYVGRLHARSMTKPTYVVRQEVAAPDKANRYAGGSSR